MKLRDKKTGENYETTMPIVFNIKTSDGGEYTVSCESIKELNEKWEDYEEPKEYYAIDFQGGIIRWARHSWDEKTTNKIKEIGNYFETEEEAEKAVEKLKAWKRLKDKGFKVDLWDYDGGNYQEGISTGRILFRVKDYGRIEENDKDLDLLFGGEE